MVMLMLCSVITFEKALIKTSKLKMRCAAHRMLTHVGLC